MSDETNLRAWVETDLPESILIALDALISERDRYRDAVAKFDTRINMIGQSACEETCLFCGRSTTHVLRHTHDLVHADDCVMIAAHKHKEQNR